MKTFFIIVIFIVVVIYNGWKFFIWRLYKTHLKDLKFGMMESEFKYSQGIFKIEDIIDIAKHKSRVGSAPIINHEILFVKYMADFCLRYNLPHWKTFKMINHKR